MRVIESMIKGGFKSLWSRILISLSIAPVNSYPYPELMMSTSLMKDMVFMSPYCFRIINNYNLIINILGSNTDIRR